MQKRCAKVMKKHVKHKSNNQNLNAMELIQLTSTKDQGDTQAMYFDILSVLEP